MQTSPQQESNSLVTWFQGEIAKLHTVPQEVDVSAELASIFAPDARITLNHVPSSLEGFQKELAASLFATVHEDIEWKDIQELKVDGSEGVEIVAGCYIVTRSLKFKIRAAPAQSKNHVVFSAKVKVEGDNRKIIEFFQTVIAKQVPVILTVPPVTS